MAAGCHSCPHGAEIERLRETCLKCKRCDGDFVKLSGLSRVSIDAAGDEACAEKMLSMRSPDYSPGKPSVSRVDVPKEVLPYLLRIVEPISQLKDKDVLLIVAMLRGERLTDIARRTGRSLQAVHARWKKILRHYPAWKVFATGMIGSGRGRKPDARNMDP